MQVKAIRRKPQNDWGFDLIPKQFDPLRTKFAKINEEFLQVETTVPSGEKLVEYHAEVIPKVEVFQRKASGKGLNVNVLLVDSTRPLGHKCSEHYLKCINSLKMISTRIYSKDTLLWVMGPRHS